MRKKWRVCGILSAAIVTCAVVLVVLGSPVLSKRQAPPPPPRPEEPKSTKITLAAAGDLLMHLQVVYSDYDPKTGTFDFGPVFAPVAPYLKSADYTVANLETRLAGASRGYHGYPLFNTPENLARDVLEAGIDLVATANNHSLDMGWDGIVTTLDNLDAAGLAHVGTSRSEAEKDKPFVVDVRGIRLGFVNYTDSTNGLPLPWGKEFAVNVLDTDAVVAAIQAVRREGADLVVAVLHMGNEYQRFSDEAQRILATHLFVYGADVVAGSHPHVVQPIEKVVVERDGAKRICVAAYSLGNFISAQDWRYSDSGIVMYLDIEKSAAGTFIRGVRYLPVWVQTGYAGGRERYRVLPIHPAMDPVTDIPITPKHRARMTQVWEELSAHLENISADILPYKPNAAKAATFF
ncbi:MAG: CapA family protein [Ammonifex sp.]|jgi:poly-gamma-glutamate synthesis protein (capsule biosynthesis protein)|nr:MAG: CapA family protein [Ammonifex sp.]